MRLISRMHHLSRAGRRDPRECRCFSTCLEFAPSPASILLALTGRLRSASDTTRANLLVSKSARVPPFFTTAGSEISARS